METITIRINVKEYNLILSALEVMQDINREEHGSLEDFKALESLENELQWQRSVQGSILERETR